MRYLISEVEGESLPANADDMFVTVSDVRTFPLMEPFVLFVFAPQSTLANVNLFNAPIPRFDETPPPTL